MWKPAEKIPLTSTQQRALLKLVNAPMTPQKMVLRANIVLKASKGVPNNRIAKDLNTTRSTVILWRNRFLADGISGLSDATRPGRNKSLPNSLIKKIVETTQFKKPKHGTHWSTRAMAKEFGVSHMIVQRIWKQFNLKPHLMGTFKISKDPQFVEKVQDIVGLYLNPPDKALVLCVDEKRQMQALDRSQPLLPLRQGKTEKRTHDYFRHGTTNLFAALDIQSSKVITQCFKRHRHQEFLRFLRKINNEIDSECEVHLVVENYCTHKHKKVRDWLSRHPRFHVHFTPTGASWVNQVETWFSILTRKTIQRGVFKSLKSLTAHVREYVRDYNETAKPFAWTKSASQILSSVPKL